MKCKGEVYRKEMEGSGVMGRTLLCLVVEIAVHSEHHKGNNHKAIGINNSSNYNHHLVPFISDHP